MLWPLGRWRSDCRCFNYIKIKESVVRIAVMYAPRDVGVEDLHLWIGPVALLGRRVDRAAAADGA